MAKRIGERLVCNGLKPHQLSQQIVDAALYEENPDWSALATKVDAKKYKGQSSKDWKARQKQQRFLQSRGFSLEQNHYALETSKN